MRLRRLQRAVLEAMREHLSYHDGCGWMWDNPSNTKRVCESLVRIGLVEKHPIPHRPTVMKYTITEAGLTVLNKK